MAALTDVEYRDLRRFLYSKGRGKEQLKTRSTLPSSTQIRAAFQVLEDDWESLRGARNTNINGAIGFPTTPALAKMIHKAWLKSKFDRGG